MTEGDVPKQELLMFEQAVLSGLEYFDVNYVKTQYTQHCSEVIADPFDLKVVKLIQQALKEKKPLSMIRLGDGEVNLLTYSCYPNTPKLKLGGRTIGE